MSTNKEIIIEWFVSPGPFKNSPEDHGGDWNGYAVITKDHPYYGMDWTGTEAISIHGGITYGASAKDCEMPELKEKFRNENYWVLGFDTVHSGDRRSLWPIERVEREAANLAGQLYMEQVKHMRFGNSNERDSDGG